MQHVCSIEILQYQGLTYFVGLLVLVLTNGFLSTVKIYIVYYSVLVYDTFCFLTSAHKLSLKDHKVENQSLLFFPHFLIIIFHPGGGAIV